MAEKTKVLIVDDSAFARFSIAKRLRTDPGIEVIGHASDGIEAIEQTKSLQPDVVTMDVTMPRMDGIEAVERIMVECPTPIVMLSALTGEGAEVTIKALELGAVDFFLKNSLVSPVGDGDNVGELLEKLKQAARIDRSQLNSLAQKPSKYLSPELKWQKKRSSDLHQVIALGSSTGGPRALNQVIPMLPGDLPAGILMVQHMPVGFTKSLAERLNNISELDVKEAENGDVLSPGVVLVAPGGSHMIVDTNGRIVLNQGPQECGLRPAVNVTMESAAKMYGDSVLGVVLTGMGSDGTRGAGLIKQAGGEVIVEHESTCVVYGMPKSVVEAGHADDILPLEKIATEIVARCQTEHKSAVGV
ncbi:MAG: chemotaxis response regulator protein-glutamate methylesterase [Chloroflexi bacterium]|jgi:two-component system, chemotaxis family, protein-glutamate methylesterase/glutaminase|nr:chemotaxis response regulator protein-glutamate methylesterase [Chloroflexota bacterium]